MQLLIPFPPTCRLTEPEQIYFYLFPLVAEGREQQGCALKPANIGVQPEHAEC